MPRRWLVSPLGNLFDEQEIDWDYLVRAEPKGWVLVYRADDGRVTVRGRSELLTQIDVARAVGKAIKRAGRGPVTLMIEERRRAG